MNKKTYVEIGTIMISLFLLITIVSGMYIYDRIYDESNLVEVTERVHVDKNIIEGYEGEDYIPRSVSINERLNDGTTKN